MPVFYNNSDYLDAAAANRNRLQKSISTPVVRDGRGWKVWPTPKIETLTSDGLKRIERENSKKYRSDLEKVPPCPGDRNSVLIDLMSEYDLSPSRVSELLETKIQHVRRWMNKSTPFSPKREFDLRRSICAGAGVILKNEEYEGMLFNVYYHNRQILSRASAVRVRTYFDNLISDRIKIERSDGIWKFIYRQSRCAPICVFSKSDDENTLIVSFINGAMRGLCAGYRFEIA